jgi:hypothetical protein
MVYRDGVWADPVIIACRLRVNDLLTFRFIVEVPATVEDPGGPSTSGYPQL